MHAVDGDTEAGRRGARQPPSQPVARTADSGRIRDGSLGRCDGIVDHQDARRRSGRLEQVHVKPMVHDHDQRLPDKAGIRNDEQLRVELDEGLERIARCS
jgi:hypothetical protein